MDPRVRWFEMPVTKQISNIGSEVARAIRWKNKGDYQKARNFCNKAMNIKIPALLNVSDASDAGLLIFIHISMLIVTPDLKRNSK